MDTYDYSLVVVGGVVQAGDPVFKVSEYLDGHCQEKPHDELAIGTRHRRQGLGRSF